MTGPRDDHFPARDADDGSAAPGLLQRWAFRRRGTAGGAGPGADARPAFGGRCVPFVVNLWADAALFAVVACVIVFAVWRQDPEAYASAAPPAARVAARAMRYAPPRGTSRPAMLPAGPQVAHRGNRNIPAATGG